MQRRDSFLSKSAALLGKMRKALASVCATGQAGAYLLNFEGLRGVPPSPRAEQMQFYQG
jgi:hypothetical protein